MPEKNQTGYGDIIFDCDSTLSAIEGIDELAVAAGKGAEVAALTNAAMDGQLPLEQVYGRRLDIIRPNRSAVVAISTQYLACIVPGAREVIQALHEAGRHVYVVSGGIAQAVTPFAESLGIPANRVHAVLLLFDRNEHYVGFAASPLTTASGKIGVIRALRRPGTRALLIGDGASDLAAAQAVDTFVGFGGVVARRTVLEQATIALYKNDLLPILQLALTG